MTPAPLGRKSPTRTFLFSLLFLKLVQESLLDQFPQQLLVFGFPLTLVGYGAFGRRQANSNARPAARFLFDSQPRVFFSGHSSPLPKPYHNRPQVRHTEGARLAEIAMMA